MPSFKTLNDGEKWDVGFYVLSLGFPGGDGNSSISSSGPKLPENIKDYKNLATISNEELISKISSLGIKNPDEKLALLRTTNIQNRSSNNSDNPINFTLSKLSDSVLFYKANKHKDSLDAAIDAYLEGFEKVEADLMAKNSSLVMEIEKNMTILRSSIKSGDNVAEIENHVELLRTDIEKAEKTLSESSIGPYVTFINSFSIILREALEAILIIAAIIAFLSVSGAKSSIKYIHYGWIAAILAGFVTWFLAKSILEISGASREVVEGITAILAAIVLFYVSYWLISKIEVEKWKDYVKSKVKRAIDKKSIIALTSVSFLAVYREAFETVLFYQALLYQSESSAMPVIWGLLAGIVIISIVAVLIFKLSIRIPLKYFFSFTSLFLYILCFILVGKGIKELQAAGFIPASKLEFIPYIDVLGMYPTYETTVPQLVIVLAFIFAFFWIAYVTQVKAKQEINTSVARISDEIKTVQASFDHIKGHIVEWRKCDDIDLEAEELDQQIHEVADDFDQLKNKLEKFNITLGNM
ncbi:MAG: hypothetical protein GTO02_09585 [Candidatus Dadabacteria bacterium]|nr:hypothetical protein [Candidatus Dadabacteria bacterium]NIQ14630.1 hypothetical protein [Candidatus Dadabacteria bacterium]